MRAGYLSHRPMHDHSLLSNIAHSVGLGTAVVADDVEVEFVVVVVVVVAVVAVAAALGTSFGRFVVSAHTHSCRETEPEIVVHLRCKDNFQRTLLPLAVAAANKVSQ